VSWSPRSFRGWPGPLGQNPRKGITHTWDDVQAELCDVMFTAMVALTTLTLPGETGRAG
jgi:hypothetical protein